MNRGRLLRPTFLAELSFALDKSVKSESLLDVTQTDLVRARLNEGYRAALENRMPSFRKFFSKDQQSHFIHAVDCLCVAIGSEKVILHIKNSEFCGAILSEALALLKRSKEIIELDGDSLSILSADHQQGLILDRNRDEIYEHYELVVWGDRWPLAML
jgi:hypothetical protein